MKMPCLLGSSLWLLSFPLYAAEQQESARTLSQSPLSAMSLLQTVMGLVLVLGCIVLVAWLLKRTTSFHTAANGKMKVIAGLPLGTRERAVLVQVGDEQLLLGVTPQQVNLLYKLDTPLPTGNTERADFAGKLRQIMQQRGER
ncbi:flagellar biosynthetic protein FliO [Methylophaga sp. OBS1]|uniref:flagellar biosynthetic protein FliO n=1 Tax=Methylophaga sp. OBS1 TaxID=2991933 RepID=UPI002259E019|nr:flagellar biosynthetic protein FliO [Methylophaga sp. OBS1]MCX4192944.1 flagellar biosynthetic protein FliO [Methylophaga sp. OBS1]